MNAIPEHGSAAPVSVDSITDPAIREIAIAVHRKGGNLPMASILTIIGARSKDCIFRSGKGIEGFLRTGAPALFVVDEKGMKHIRSNIHGVAAEENAGGGEASSPATAPTTPVPVPPGKLFAATRRPCPLSEGNLQALETIVRRAHASGNGFAQTNEWFQFIAPKCSFDAFFKVLVDSSLFEVQGTAARLKVGVLEGQYPRFPSPSASTSASQPAEAPAVDDTPKPPARSVKFAVIKPSAGNNWGGWGGQANVPTSEDVFGILKFVPVHWGNLGALNVPAVVKKRHVRIASFLQWLRRQPKYFEVRNIAGTLEVRRAVTLHPEQHGKTPQEAAQWLSDRIASGEHNAILTSTDNLGTTSQAATAIYKFMVRVVPGYFVAPELVLMRYTKKGLSISDIAQAAREHPSIFETFPSHDGQILIRRRTGADSSKWRDEFSRDYLGISEDIAGLFILMGRSSVCWDRPEYLYVRLLDAEKIAVGGYEGMLSLMRRHPSIFKMGEVFFRRVDHSDPASEEDEPQQDAVRSGRKTEENVYHGHRDIATIFHYISPDEGAVNLNQLSDCASPAIHAELPPRIVTVLQMFPDLFACRETTPGVFTVRKIVPKVADAPSAKKPVQYGSGFFHSPGTSGAASAAASSAAASASDMDDMMMGDDGDEALTRRETVEAVRGLIPSRGVEAAQLEQWLSMEVKKGVKTHFDTLQGLLSFNGNVFKVEASGMVTLAAPSP